MGLLRHPVRNSSIAKGSYKKEIKHHKDYAGAFGSWLIGILIFVAVWFFFTAIIWMLDRSTGNTKTLFQYICAQWDWIKDIVKHIF